MIALLNSTATFLCKWSFLTVSQQTSFILFSLSYLSRGYIYLLIFIEICPLSILFSAEIPFLLLCLRALLLGQNERSCALQREIRKKVLLAMEELWGEEGLQQSCCRTPVPKVVLQQNFPGLCRGGAGRCAAGQSRDPLLAVTSTPGLQGRAGAWLGWSPGSSGAVWLCPASRSPLGTGSQAGDRSPGAGHSPHRSGGVFAVPDLQQGVNGCVNVWGSLSIHKGRKVA